MKLKVLPFIFLLILIPHRFAFAQGTSLGIYPPIFQVNTTPPAQVEAPLTIQNRGDDPINLRIELRPFVASDREDGQIKYISQSEANFRDPLILQRVQILDGSTITTTLSLASKQEKNLTLRINIPRDDPSADYYFSIIFLTTQDSIENANVSKSVSGIATNVLLSIGAGKATGAIQEFFSPLLVERGPIPFTVRVKNTGNSFVSPKGEIIIKNIFDQPIGRVDLAQVNILSKSVRSIPSIDFLDEEKNLPEKEIAASWDEKFVLGPYKASLSLAISDQGPILRRDVFFFAFPFKVLVGVVLAILIVLYVIIKVKSRV